MRCGSSCSNCETDDGEFMTLGVLKDIVVENIDELADLPSDDSNYNETDSDSSSSSTSYSIPLTKTNTS